MFQVGKAGPATAAMSEATQVVNSPIAMGGAAEAGGLLSTEKDAKESATAPQFGDVYKQIQAKYGERPEKPREIKKNLGKDDFLRIMLTQMKNQDPTNPFKPEQMATEIAQFTSVEQLQNVNQNLNKMESQNKSFGQMAMTHLIGKTVTIDRERFPHVEGQNESLTFKLPRNSSSTQIAIVSELGEVVLEKEIGPEKAGDVSFQWDGIKSNTLPAKSGNYSLRVEAKNEKGQPIETNPQTQARVIGISFEGAEPVFLVGDAHRYDKVTMKNIVRVDSDGPDLSQQKKVTTPSLPEGIVMPTQPSSASLQMPPNPVAEDSAPQMPNMQRQTGIPNQVPLAQAQAAYQAAQGAADLQSAPVVAGNESPYRAAALAAASENENSTSGIGVSGLEEIQKLPNFIPFNNFAETAPPEAKEEPKVGAIAEVSQNE